MLIHSKGILHRDLSSMNIVLDKNYQNCRFWSFTGENSKSSNYMMFQMMLMDLKIDKVQKDMKRVR